MRVEGVFTIACLVKAGCTSADSRRSGFLATPVEKPGFQILYSDPDFTAEPEEVAASGDPDYQRVLRQAAGKHGDALERLFAISARGLWDVAAAEFHHSNMRRMLLVWGDADFARVLARQPRAIRRAVDEALSWPQESEFRHHFPQTYAVAKKT
jgi:hypothetical protein